MGPAWPGVARCVQQGSRPWGSPGLAPSEVPCPPSLGATDRWLPFTGPSHTTCQSQQRPPLFPGSLGTVGESPWRTVGGFPARPRVARLAGASSRWRRLCLASVTCWAGRQQQGPWQRPRKPLIFPTLTVIRATEKSKRSGRRGFFPAARHIGAGRGAAVAPWRDLLGYCLLFTALCSAEPQNLAPFTPGRLSKEAEGCQEPVLGDGLSMG